MLSLLLRHCWCLALEYEPGKEVPLAVELTQASNWGGSLRDMPASFLSHEMILLGIPSSKHLVSLNSGFYGLLGKT